jgi:hypothetical protein
MIEGRLARPRLPQVLFTGSAVTTRQPDLLHPMSMEGAE